MCRFCQKNGAHKEANCVRNPASRNYGKSLSQIRSAVRTRTPRRGPPPSRSTYAPRPMTTTPTAWNNWAVGEETRVNAYKTPESYEQQKLEMEKRKKEDEEPYEYTLRETFKRTGGRTVTGQLGGKPIYEEITHTERVIKVGGSATPSTVPEAEEKKSGVKDDVVAQEEAPVVEKKKAVVPPHLRPKKL